MSTKRFSLANNPLFQGQKYSEREINSGIPYKVIEIKNIEADPNQPRREFDENRLKELSESIKLYGVLSPILVRPNKEKPGCYLITSGERRFRASQLAGLTSIPAIVDATDFQEDRTLAIQLVENLQRSDLSSLERAQAIGALRDNYTLSVRDIADKLGVSKSMVQRSLEILELPADLMNALRNGASESKVLLLSKIEDEEIRASYLKDIESLTRDQLQGKLQNDSGTKKSQLSPDDQRIIDDMQRSLGMRVRMTKAGENTESGRISIDFSAMTDLQELYRRIAV